jgi:glycosyltransferase involved in cell wall biosynthesis
MEEHSMNRAGPSQSRLRIAQVAPLYEAVPPRLYGGTERVVSYLTEELVQLGHDVTLFASADACTTARLIPCCRQATRLDPSVRDPIIHHLLMLEHVRQHRETFDLIHFHTDYLHIPMFRDRAGRTVTTLHGRLDLPDLQPFYQEFDDIPLVSISDHQRTPMPPVRWLGTVHHGIPANLLRPHRGPGSYLAFLGRIAAEKQPDHAIEIAKRSGWPLKIAAKVDKVDRDYFRSTIEPLLDHPLVDFIGEIGEDRKSDFLGNAAALLFPIDWPEPFGLVMIEAMAAGTPVIAYPCGSVPEVIDDGVTGFLVSGVSDAVDAVRRLGELDRAIVRRRFEERFTTARMAKDYVTLYRRLLDGHESLIGIDAA